MQPSAEVKNKFDLLNSSLVMAHMTNPKAALKNMLSLVKPGGRLIAEEVDISALSSNKLIPGKKICSDFGNTIWLSTVMDTTVCRQSQSTILVVFCYRCVRVHLCVYM